MPDITLHRVDRLLKALATAIAQRTPKASATLPVFTEDPAAAIASLQDGLGQTLHDLTRLYAIRSKIRAAQDRQNAEAGISDLLARRHMLTDVLGTLNKLLGVAPEDKADDTDLYAHRRRRAAAKLELLDLDATVRQIEALAKRFSTGEGETSATIAVSLMTPALVTDFRDKAAEARRALEEVSDQIHSANARTKINIGDDDWSWLQSQKII